MSETFEQLDPNYVIAFDYSKENLTYLIMELSAKGLHVLTMPGYDENTVYAFTRIQEHNLTNNVQIEGKSSIEVDKESGDDILLKILQPLKFVKSVTRIHDYETRKKLESKADSLIEKSLSLPSDHDLLLVEHLTRNPRQALYFAYFKTYIHWLIPLSVIGAIFRLFPSSTAPWEFNISYSLSLIIWSLLFTSTWVYKLEPFYSSKFGKVQSYTEISERKLSTPSAVLYKKLCFIPVAILFVFTLISFQFFCFFIEIFITQFYSGPLSSFLALIPTVLISVFIPVLTTLYNKFFVNKLVEWEDGPNPLRSKVEKNFVLTFFTSYMPLLITLFFYLPMGYRLTPELRATIAEWSFRLHIPIAKTDFVIDVNRYRKQFFYFTVTNQVIVISMENFLPFFMDKVLPIFKKEDKESAISSTVKSHFRKEFSTWQKINSFHVSAYGEFDVDDSFKKLIIQFGYLCMFSTIWPLAPLVCLLFNYFIFKADLWRALKKCRPSSNPNDIQVNENNYNAVGVSADPWDSVLEAITWIGGTVCPTLLIMYRYCGLPGVGLQTKLEKRDLWYRHSPLPYSWTTILLVAIFSEHTALLSYFYLKKLLIASKEKFTRGFVPATELQEPPKIDLSAVVKDTVSFMSEISSNQKSLDAKETKSASTSKVDGLTSTSKNAEKRSVSSHKQTPEERLTKETSRSNKSDTSMQPGPRAMAPAVTVTRTTGSSQKSAAVGPQASLSSAPGTSSTKSTKSTKSIVSGVKELDSDVGAEGSDLNGKEYKQKDISIGDTESFNQLQNKNASEGSFSVAGATLPDTIPTSKNYHLRYDKDGRPIQSPNSTETSESSLLPDPPSHDDKPKNAKKPIPKESLDNTNYESLQNERPTNELKTQVSEVHHLDPSTALNTIQHGSHTQKEILGHSSKSPEADPTLAAAAAASALASHSRTSSQVNAVQQFGRDVPTSIESTKTSGTTATDPKKGQLNRSNSVKSKTPSRSHTQTSSVPNKSSAVSKRSSLDHNVKETPKHKHKKGLLHKLKKKL